MLGAVLIALSVGLSVPQHTLKPKPAPKPPTADSVVMLLSSSRLIDREAAVMALENRPELSADAGVRKAALDALAAATEREVTRRDDRARGLPVPANPQEGALILGLVKVLVKLDGTDVLTGLLPHVAQPIVSAKIAKLGREVLPALRQTYASGRGPDGQKFVRMGVLFTMARMYSSSDMTLADRAEMEKLAKQALDGPEAVVVVGGARLAVATGQVELRARVIDLAAGRATIPGMSASDRQLSTRMLQSTLRDAGIVWRAP